jgi:hypothetical protein
VTNDNGGTPPFVPEGFDVPFELSTKDLRLEPLGPQHNDSDFHAWTSSLEHVRATPGFRDGPWPREMTSEENRSDLERHARDFSLRTGFTYTVLEAGSDNVVGCVYIYPSQVGGYDARIRSWVRADRADLDGILYGVVLDWLRRDWPFEAVEYDKR